MILELTDQQIVDQEDDPNPWAIGIDLDGYVRRKLIAVGFRVDRPIASWRDWNQCKTVFQQDDRDVHPVANREA